MSKQESDRPVAVVTGAGSGIGRATAIMLAARGYAVVLAGRRESALNETAALLTKGAVSAQMVTDVGSVMDVERMIDTTEALFGRLDVLVNNAGLSMSLPIAQTTPGELDEMFRVNALGTAWAIHFAWPIFTKQKRGCVVNVSSMASYDPFPGFFGYSASKASVNLMAASVAKEGKAIGVRGFSVAPTATETAMLRSLFDEKMLPREKCMTPEQVAQVIVECIEGKRDAENGRTIPMYQGMPEVGR